VFEIKRETIYNQHISKATDTELAIHLSAITFWNVLTKDCGYT